MDAAHIFFVFLALDIVLYNNNNYDNILCLFSTVCELLHQFLYAADSLIRTAHLDKAKSTAFIEANAIIAKLKVLYTFFEIYTSSALVSVK